jgi:hypothetical protein
MWEYYYWGNVRFDTHLGFALNTSIVDHLEIYAPLFLQSALLEYHDCQLWCTRPRIDTHSFTVPHPFDFFIIQRSPKSRRALSVGLFSSGSAVGVVERSSASS